LAIFCYLYLVQDSFTDYLLCVSSDVPSDEGVAGHNERITPVMTRVRPGLYIKHKNASNESRTKVLNRC